MVVGEILNRHIATIHAGAALQEAAELIARSGVSELMVVDENGDFVGILSEDTILAVMLPNIDEVCAIGGSVDDAYAVFLQKGLMIAKRPIFPLITRDVAVLSPNAHVAQAAIVLTDGRHCQLPVVENGKLLGTVRRSTVCHAAVRRGGQQENARDTVSISEKLQRIGSAASSILNQWMSGVSSLLHPSQATP